jgi:NIMA (never in mitosis gene a)-related kinase
VWALGVIIYHLTALKLPFDANSLPVLALKILKGAFPPISGNNYSKELKNTIASMLIVDQRKRPSIN